MVNVERNGVLDVLLVTGGAGFVGSNLAIGLRDRGLAKRVVALDNLKRRGSELNLPRLQKAGVEFVHGDIRRSEDLAAAGPFGLIVECSAEPSVLAGYEGSPRYVIDTNLVGTVNCLELARQQGAGIVFLSTSRVYPVAALNALALTEAPTRFVLDEAQPLPGVSARGVAETFPLDGVRSLYGATKLCSELLLREYVDMYGLRAIANRCGVIAGPWQMGRVDQGVVALWVARHVYGGRLDYIGYGGVGKQVRDVLHVDDLLRLVAFQATYLDTLKGETFNVGGGIEVSASLQELTALCQEVTGNRIPIGRVAETRPADVPWYVTDYSKVARAAGWRPEKDLRAIVTDIHSWIETHREVLRPIFAD
jgi:CDP-paratose 2-epimerase